MPGCHGLPSWTWPQLPWQGLARYQLKLRTDSETLARQPRDAGLGWASTDCRKYPGQELPAPLKPFGIWQRIDCMFMSDDIRGYKGTVHTFASRVKVCLCLVTLLFLMFLHLVVLTGHRACTAVQGLAALRLSGCGYMQMNKLYGF